MIVVMDLVNPIPGKEDEMVNRMRSFRSVLQTQSGLVKTFVLKERDGKTIVGVSMWTDEAAYKSHGEYAGTRPDYASRWAERESADDA